MAASIDPASASSNSKATVCPPPHARIALTGQLKCVTSRAFDTQQFGNYSDYDITFEDTGLSGRAMRNSFSTGDLRSLGNASNASMGRDIFSTPVAGPAGAVPTMAAVGKSKSMSPTGLDTIEEGEPKASGLGRQGDIGAAAVAGTAVGRPELTQGQGQEAPSTSRDTGDHSLDNSLTSFDFSLEQMEANLLMGNPGGSFNEGTGDRKSVV